MKKPILSIIIVFVLAMVLVIPASATPPTNAEGDITALGPQTGTMTGTFSGTYTAIEVEGRVVWLIFEGIVDGLSGTMIYKHVDDGPNGFRYWTILEGTGDLANIHGQGTYWFTGPRTARYQGQYHFEP